MVECIFVGKLLDPSNFNVLICKRGNNMSYFGLLGGSRCPASEGSVSVSHHCCCCCCFWQGFLTWVCLPSSKPIHIGQHWQLKRNVCVALTVLLFRNSYGWVVTSTQERSSHVCPPNPRKLHSDDCVLWYHGSYKIVVSVMCPPLKLFLNHVLARVVSTCLFPILLRSCF